MQNSKNVLHVCFWYISLCKVFKKSFFAFKWAAPWIKGSGNCLGTVNIRSRTLKKKRLGTKSLSATNHHQPTHHHPCISCCGAHPPPLYQSPPHPPPPNKVIKVSSQYCTRSKCTTIEHMSVYDSTHAKNQEYSSCFLVHFYLKSSKNYIFLLLNGPPPESTLNQRVGQWLRDSEKYSLGGP